MDDNNMFGSNSPVNEPTVDSVNESVQESTYETTQEVSQDNPNTLGADTQSSANTQTYSQNDNSQNDYSKNTYSQNTYNQTAYGQNTYGQNTYGQNTYGQNTYGYEDTYSQTATKDNSYKTASGGVEVKKNSIFKKAVKFVLTAACFGVIAGGCFFGVNYVAGKLTQKETVSTTTVNEKTTTNSNSKVGTTTVGTGSETSTDLTNLVDESMPSIVSITMSATQTYEYWGQNYQQEYQGSGSGIIVGQSDSELLIATNNHVVDGATAINITFIDDSTAEATIKGKDSSADLAVVAVDLKDISEETMSKIKVATLGKSDGIKVGQMAIAIGNSLGYGQSVTVGYISAKDRTVEVEGGSGLKLLQTDAAINPGNSGGALLNINGEVIGINSAKYSDTSVEGMGYAIPISSATPIIDELMNREELKDNERGYLGISGQNITKENNTFNMPTGVYVFEVAKGGAAEEAGILTGDIIVGINDMEVTTIESIQEKVNNTKAGTKINVTVMRNENGSYVEKKLSVTLKDSKSLDTLESSKNSNKQQQQQMPQQQNPQQEDPQQKQQQGNPFGEDDSQSIQDFLEQFYNN
ncbi:MAG: trypsin-like peptidase domain-containing protein [Lachnospiraceae bacterium]|nr:trypsin-like peptidase domain-containing protein [Lachnospiraceae bacterium]